jgi:multidrug efflux pump
MGLLPMVFGLTIQFGERSILSGAPSSQWWTDLSSTIAGGLTFATILTLLATPALLVLGDNVNAWLKRVKLRFSRIRPDVHEENQATSGL